MFASSMKYALPKPSTSYANTLPATGWFKTATNYGKRVSATKTLHSVIDFLSQQARFLRHVGGLRITAENSNDSGYIFEN